MGAFEEASHAENILTVITVTRRFAPLLRLYPLYLSTDQFIQCLFPHACLCAHAVFQEMLKRRLKISPELLENRSSSACYALKVSNA